MADTEINNIPEGKKRNKKFGFGFLYLFLFAFLGALAFISYLVKSYSPDIDVTIGNNEALTLGETEMDVEIKSIDERLKWIQMEDELPGVALRNFEQKEKKKEKLEEEQAEKEIKSENKTEENKKDYKKTVKEPPVPAPEKIKKSDFREIPAANPVIASPKPAITKVYMGSYSTIEDAMKVQAEMEKIEPSLAPFVKSVKGYYIVQLGSFSDKERATALITKLRDKGYSPKISSEN